MRDFNHLCSSKSHLPLLFVNMPKRSSKKSQPASVRIIAGDWRGRRLPVLDKPGLRPSTDRTRETLFNWLMGELAGARCLDLFAGTGALGIECLSRGAAFAQFCEIDKQAALKLQDNLKALIPTDTQGSARANVHAGSAFSFINSVQKNAENKPFDVVFLDPPFADKALLEQALLSLHNSKLIKDHGLVYIERNRFDADFESESLVSMNSQKNAEESPSDGGVSAHFEEYKTQNSSKVSYGLYVYRASIR